MIPHGEWKSCFSSLTSQIQVRKELFKQLSLKKNTPKLQENTQQQKPQQNAKAPQNPFPQKQMVWEWAMIGNTTEVKCKFLTTICLIVPGTMP